MKTKIKNFFKALIDAPGVSSMMQNAFCGLPNSQLQLAEYYLIEKKDFLEAYAWADVAYCRNLHGAEEIRRIAKENIKPEQIKEAWELARKYKNNFIPPRDSLLDKLTK